MYFFGTSDVGNSTATTLAPLKLLLDTDSVFNTKTVQPNRYISCTPCSDYSFIWHLFPCKSLWAGGQNNRRHAAQESSIPLTQ